MSSYMPLRPREVYADQRRVDRVIDTGILTTVRTKTILKLMEFYCTTTTTSPYEAICPLPPPRA